MNTIRASDAERETIASILQRAAGAGRLSAEEAGERLAQAGSARFREELAALVSDLPERAELDRPTVGHRRPPLWAWLAWRGLRLGAVVVLFVTLWRLFRFHWFFFPAWPLAVLFAVLLMARRELRWRRRMYWGRPYWSASHSGV